MSSCRCYIVPPYLLRGIADSSSNSEEVRNAAKSALESRELVTKARHERLAALSQPRGYARSSNVNFQTQPIVPDSLLRHLSESDKVDEDTRARAKRDLEHLESVIGRFQASQEGQSSDQQTLAATHDEKAKPVKKNPYRAVYNASGNFDEEQLPGKLVRAEGEPPVEDKSVNEAFENIGIVLDFYKKHFQWNSIDNRNMDVISSVHFGKNYANAFWFPQRLQMVFGDGDDFLNNFTGCIDVIGHELCHAVTEHTSPLDYWGMSGALNEHVSDVFGIMVKQQVQDENSETADWLIGEDCILPGVKGTALRSMKSPGEAYNDPRFGKDPQVDHMDAWETMFEDNGGVHIFSGIPNKAFFLACQAFGGYSWEKAGKIWWKTMTSGRIPPKCTFKQFADVTVDVAEEEFDQEAAQKVRKAWTQVGVVRNV
jgi:Zn-dependent metalloprotease